MGEAADDAYDLELQAQDIAFRMKAAGARRCPRFDLHDVNECPLCKDLGWIDKDGNPCEP